MSYSPCKNEYRCQKSLLFLTTVVLSLYHGDLLFSSCLTLGFIWTSTHGNTWINLCHLTQPHTVFIVVASLCLTQIISVLSEALSPHYIKEINQRLSNNKIYSIKFSLI